MKTFTNPDHFTFTNQFGVPHFNKSLLKTRIEMMNKSKSKWMGVGKYFLFVATLWLCAAFTKPYREEIAAKIVEKVPELKEVFERQNPPLTQLNDFVLEAPPKPVSSTKYVIYKENRLYWVVTPKVTFKDLAAIQQEFKKVGGVFFVKQMKYDPLGFYLTEISIQTSYLKGGGVGSTDDLKAVDKPIAAFGGWIDTKKHSLGISDNSHDPIFDAIATQDKNDVEKWINNHSSEYNKAKKEEKSREEDALLKDVRSNFYKNPLKAANGFIQFGQEALQYIYQMGVRNRIYFVEEGALRVENLYTSSHFLIDNQPSTLQQAEQLKFDNIRTIACSVVYTDSTRQSAQRTIAIITHNYKP
jgi:hypothetical protein